jgi:glyoxylase I family protein
MAEERASQRASATFVKSVHGVRYQVKDVARAAAFYSERLGFTLKHQQLPAFANVSLGGVDILLSGPGASGSRPMPDGSIRCPEGGIVSCCAWPIFPPASRA